MSDALTAWWAQQLLLCDGVPTAHPLALDSVQAEKRLKALGISHRGELVETFLHGLGATSAPAYHLLGALEYSALAGAAGWLTQAQACTWAHHVMRRIGGEYHDLRSWLRDLRLAFGERASRRAHERFLDACQTLTQREKEADTVSWEAFEQALVKAPAPNALWPQAPGTRPWRLGALFHPVMCYPATPGDWPEARQWLSRVWQVDDRDQLLGVVLWLSAQGDRQRWDIEARELLEMDQAQRLEWQRGADDDSAYAPVLVQFVSQNEPFDWAGWDWLRIVELAWAGACSGLLSQAEADDIAAHSADLIGQRYGDWPALLAAYRRGQSLFEGIDRRDMTPGAHATLLLKAACSPWDIAPNALLDSATQSASRTRIKGFRASGHHWLLALASVREPDALLRQVDPGAFMGEKRRADAALYLQDALSLHADEGAGALERYWLPAQAHHLNQLAADAVHGVMPPAQTLFGRPSVDDARQLQSLKGVSRHAATIHMAEKFAFYLYMAFDSHLFESKALTEYADALKSCLCRFYPSPKHLLEAWFAWEGCLPEPEHDSLIGEIAWHLDDPGSLFYWLDWHPGSWREPGERPSLTHFTAMALVGPLNSAVWSEPQIESEREKASIREWVDTHYHLSSAADMQDFLGFMLESGDRQEYQINYAPYTLNPERLESEIAILESGECVEEERHHLLRLRRVRDNEDGCNDVDMAAWDIAQLMDLAIAGRQLGWLDQNAFNRTLDRAYQLADTHYAGWQEYAAGMYAGFSFFMGETPEREEFLAGFRQAMVAWLSGAPILAGPWTSLDFPGTRPRHFAPLHIDTLPGDQRILH
ncbi:YbeU/YbeR family protein [Halomonas sp. PAMB 3232]|uniref:YbeU/YbeR family protein n=1 Tax=Halomonas sp. PAMB 3232 TaxID=3075221 RepID=UPI0028A25B59|nr:YbeU/YbeR family protein [Halomonas sp. PAMB 3232]WNL37983.1 YbeU/YbeR family protein [Halomonas sp. PAMB 3232]